MRQIEFKYYMQHIETKEWRPVKATLDEIEDPGKYTRFHKAVRAAKDWALQGRSQFTGMTDVNGTGIYEHDIVRYDDGGHVYGGVVKWSKDSYCWFIDDNYCDDPLFEFSIVDLEVVGNIYQNPELLNEESGEKENGQ